MSKTLTIAAAVALAVCTGGTAHAGATPTQKCQSAKLKLVAKKGSCALGAAAKGSSDFSKCSSAFASGFAKLKTTCNGTETALENQVDTFRSQIVAALVPVSHKCEAGKMKATAKKQACKLAAEGKAILKATPADATKCVAKFDSTFAKLESGGCPIMGDANAIENDVDTFVAGIVSTLTGPSTTTSTSTTSTSSSTIIGTTTSTTLVSATVWVIRVGDGAENLALDAADSVFIDKFHLDGSSGGGTIALPTAPSGGNQPFTQSGAESEGLLSRSADGHFVSLSGYAAAPGTAAVGSTASSAVQRVVARISAAGVVNSSTVLGTTAITGNQTRSAASVDGTAFWVSGAGNPNGGVWYATLGGGTVTQIETTPGGPTSVRGVGIFGGQLFGSGNNNGFKQVFTVGTGLPTTTGQAVVTLPGMVDASPFGFVLLDRTAVPGLDTMYVADNTALPAGGIQKWTFDGTTWTLGATFNTGLSAPVRGLAGLVSGANVTLIATTNEATANNLVVVVDNGSPSPAAATIATAPSGTQFRGVALAPQ